MGESKKQHKYFVFSRQDCLTGKTRLRNTEFILSEVEWAVARKIENKANFKLGNLV